MKFNLLAIVILIIILLHISDRYEGIQFSASFMKPFYAKNNITIDRENQVLMKNGKQISFKNGLNITGKSNISKDKHKTKIVLRNNNIPTPIWYYWNTNKSFNTNIILIKKTLSFPIVIKPNSLEQGTGVHTNVLNIKDAIKVIRKLLLTTNDLIMENQLQGDAHRIFIFNDEFIDCYRIHKPSIKGNGHNTVTQLIHKFNANAEKKLSNSQIDYNLIKSQGYHKNSIIPKNKKIIITNLANGSVGSVPEFINIKDIHPSNIAMFKRITKLVNLNACGIDYITHDLSIPHYVYGSVLETNSQPGIETHAIANPKSIHKFVNLIRF